MGYSPWGHKELDITENTSIQAYIPEGRREGRGGKDGGREKEERKRTEGRKEKGEMRKRMRRDKRLNVATGAKR